MGDEVPEDTDGLLAEVVGGFGAGSRIAGYRLEGQIGAGGMAVVFRARDERLGRLVALKILAPTLAADQAFRQRFIRGIVYAGSDDHNVYAINRITGRLRWEHTTGGPISSSPAVARGIVYIGSDDRYIYALRAGNGHIRWRYATDGQVFSSPIVADGTVYISSYDKLYALNAATSRVRWKSPIDDPKTEYSPRHAVLSRPELADGVVYVGSDDHKIYELNADTGS